MKVSDILEKEDNFIKLYKFTCSLPKEQSYMLSYLIDAERFVEVGLSDDPDYFEVAQVGFISKLLTGWSPYEIRSAIDGLVSSGYVWKRVLNIDGHNRTYIKLNVANIKKLNDQYKKSLIPNCKNLNMQTEKNEVCKLQKVNRINNNNKEQIQEQIKDNTNELVKNNENEFPYPIDESNDVSHRNGNYLADSKSAVMVRSQVRGAYPGELGEIIVKWYDAVGISRKITFAQIQAKLEQLDKECNGDNKLIIQQINYSYLNNYPAWYPPKAIKRNVSNSVSIRPEEIDKSGYRNRI